MSEVSKRASRRMSSLLTSLFTLFGPCSVRSQEQQLRQQQQPLLEHVVQSKSVAMKMEEEEADGTFGSNASMLDILAAAAIVSVAGSTRGRPKCRIVCSVWSCELDWILTVSFHLSFYVPSFCTVL